MKKKVDGGTSVTTRAVNQELGANLHHMVSRESITLREPAVTWVVIHREERDKANLDGHCLLADTRADQGHREEEVEETVLEVAVAVADTVVVVMEVADKEVVMHPRGAAVKLTNSSS